MRKNRTMRAAALLLALTLITSCFVGGTFAKYTTSATSSDSARVAYWGFQRTNSMELTNLFLGAYDDVDSVDDKDVIAPGTSGSETFAFAWDESTADGSAIAVTGPEVGYNFTVAVTESCDQSIKENANIQWKLDDGAWGTWDTMIAAIKALSGDASGSKYYAPNTLPAGFTATDDVHTISWQWIFCTSDDADTTDTTMGNAEDLANCSIEIKITAEQVDSAPASNP